MTRRFAVVLALILAGCSPSGDSAEPSTTTTSTPTSSAVEAPEDSTTSTTLSVEFAVTSPAFAEGAPIPPVHTCDGEDLSPQLDLVGLPATTETLAIIVTDPDAPVGTWDHWVEFDIPVTGDTFTLSEGTPSLGVQGVNSWNLEGYMGPCPPTGEEHRYVFTVYAMAGHLGLPSGVGAEAVLEAVEPRALGSAQLTGLYAR
jgi:Raf kinase inhibitor-like YbhB/YbcL family protein